MCDTHVSMYLMHRFSLVAGRQPTLTAACWDWLSAGGSVKQCEWGVNSTSVPLYYEKYYTCALTQTCFIKCDLETAAIWKLNLNLCLALCYIIMSVLNKTSKGNNCVTMEE